MKTKIFILGLLLSAVSTFGQWNPTPFMRDYGNHRTNAIDARIGISALGTNDAVPLGFTGALTVTTNGSGVVIAAIAITPGTLNIRPGNGMTTLGDGTNVANNRLEIYDTATRNVLIQSAGISFLNGGNVGIATNNPQQALHVTGTIRATAFEDQNGNPISGGGGGGGDVKTNANNTYTPNSTNSFSALTTFSNAVVIAGTAQFPLLAPSTLYGGDGGRNLVSYGPGNGINIGGGLVVFSGTNSNWTTPDDYIAVADSNGKMTNRTPITIVFVPPGLAVGTVGTTNYVTNTLPNYVFLSPGFDTTTSGNVITVSNSVSGASTQTPLRSDIDGAGFQITNLGILALNRSQPLIIWRSQDTNDFSMDVRQSIRTNLFLPAAVMTFEPNGTNSTDTRDFRMALDLFTKGSPTDRASVGTTWSDWCNTNAAGIVSGNFNSFRGGIFADGTVYSGSAAAGSGIVTNYYLEPYGGQVIANGGFGKLTGFPNSSKFIGVSTGSIFAGGYNNTTPVFSLNSGSDGTFSFYDYANSGTPTQVMIGSNGIAIFPNGIQVPNTGSGTIDNGVNVGDLTVWNGATWQPQSAGFYRVTGSTTNATATNLLTVALATGSSVTIKGTFLLHGQTTNGHSATFSDQVGLFRNDSGTVTSLGSNTTSHFPATGWSGTNWDGRYTISGTNILIQGVGDTNGERVDFVWQGHVIGNAAIQPNVASPKIWLNSTNLPASGSISTWADSGTGTYSFTNNATQPVFIAGPNSQRAAYFNGTSSFLWSTVAARSLLNNVASCTIITVLAPNVTNVTGQAMIFTVNAAGSARAGIGEISTGGLGTFSRRLDADGIISTVLSHVVVSNYYILSADYVPTSGPTMTAYTNGVTYGSANYAGTGNFQALDSQSVTMGAVNGSSSFYNGNIAEVLVFIPAIDSTSRTYWNSYLKTKFGL